MRQSVSATALWPQCLRPASAVLGHGCVLSRAAYLGQVGVVSVVLDSGGLYAAMGFRCVCCIPSSLQEAASGSLV